MIVTPPVAPQSYWREVFHKIFIFRAGWRQVMVSEEQNRGKTIENDEFRVKIMIFLDFSFSAAPGMLPTPLDAPQSYCRVLFHKIIYFHELCRRVGGSEWLATSKIKGKP